MTIRKLIEKVTEGGTATVWSNPVPDGYGGFTFDAPETIYAWWKQDQKLYKDTDGNEFISQGEVIVREDITAGSYIYNGTSTEANPLNQNGAYMIRAIIKVPDIKQAEYFRKLILANRISA
jgi:hypothetical protein